MGSDDKGRDFFSTPTVDQDAIALHSPVKVWYYTRMKGYEVVRQTASPAPGMFGTIAYRRTWILKRNEDD